MKLHAFLGETHTLSLNRSEADPARFSLPADGWYQIARASSVSKSLDLPGGKSVRIRQVITPDDLAAIANRYAAAPGELLVDFDHAGATATGSTKAASWITAVEARGDELWAQMRLSASGHAALTGGDYRHFSPVFGFPVRPYAPGEEAHPVALLGGAITNQPTFKGMLPLSNRDDSSPPEPNTHMDYKTLLITLLGLQAAASDADIQAAAERAKTLMADGSKYADTKCRLDKLAAEQIERDLDSKGLKGPERDTWKAALTRNRDEALPLLATVKPGAPAAGDDKGGYVRTHNREDAGTPGDGNAAKDEVRAAKVSARAGELRRDNPTLTLAAAYNRAEREIDAEPARA